jgi:hypothetical protein
MSEKQFNQACERMSNGEVELITKLRESFVFTAQQELEIKEILG